MKREIYSTTLVIMIAILLLTSVIASKDSALELTNSNSADVQAVVSTNPTSVSNSNTVSDREYFTKDMFLELVGK